VRQLPSLLRYEDRNSMAFSVEARTPFLDYRLVEFALALPFDERIDGEWTKIALRRGMQGTLPDEITWRRDKLGYPTPIAIWLRNQFRADAEEIIFSEEFRGRGIFHPKVEDSLWRQHQSGEKDTSWSVWRWLSLEMWFRVFIDGAGVPKRAC
jgi:asparagine synthase (glutamine-hydrolysing)